MNDRLLNSIRVFLFESRIDNIKKRFSNISTKHDPNAEHNDPDSIVDHFSNNSDPTDKKKYTQWIMGQYSRGHIKQEDHGKIKDVLTNFEQHKNKLDKKDINQYRHISDVNDAVSKHVGTYSSKREEKKHIKKEGADLIHSENGVQVYHLKTKEAACQYGKNTKWCTSSTNDDGTPSDDNAFDKYNKAGKIYFVKARDENGDIKKYQFHHETGSYMDENDEEIELKDFVSNNPELKNVEEWQGEHALLTHRKNIDKFINSDDSDLRLNMASHPDLNTEQIDKLFNYNDPYIDFDLSSHKRLNDDHIDRLLKKGGFLIKKELTKHPNLNDDHIDKLISDKDTYVRREISKHPNLKDEHVDKIFNKKNNENSILSLSDNDNLSPYAIDKLIDFHKQNYYPELLDDLSTHSNTSKENLEKIISHSTDKHTIDYAKGRIERGDFTKTEEDEHPRVTKFLSKLKNDGHSDDVIEKAKKIMTNESILNYILSKDILNFKKVITEELATLINIKINEAKQVGTLYHYTDSYNAHKILKDNKLKVGYNVDPTVSTTRNKNLHKTGKISSDGYRNVVPMHVSLEIDGDSLSNHHKIAPYNDYNKTHKTFVRAKKKNQVEAEQVVHGDIDNIKKHVKKIRVHYPLDNRSLKDLESHNIPIEHTYKT